MRSIDRRQFVRGAVAAGTAAWAATSCGTDDKGGPGTTVAGNFVLGATFPRSEPYVVASQPNRLPFVIAGSDGAPLDTIDDAVTFRVRQGDTEIGEIAHRIRSTGLARPFVAVDWTPPEAGFYEISATYRGVDLTPVALQVFDTAAVTIPQIGMALPAVLTPTEADPAGVDPICTAEPPCPLHQVELTAQRATSRPVAVLVSTPAFCQTNVCGPVLELVVAAAAERSGIDVIHAEVYANPNTVDSIAQASLAPAVEAWGFTFEPCLMIADASGTITQRLDLIFDGDEIADAFDSVS